MNPVWWQQIKAIIRLELRKTFFARRGLWIYLLALAPVALFSLQAIVESHMRDNTDEAPLRIRRVSDAEIHSIQSGMAVADVIAKLGEPYRQTSEALKYPRDNGSLIIFVSNGVVSGFSSRGSISFEQETYVFAGVFQFFYIRLAVFFGCLGIFMNLIRGEMLDRTLHFYLLTPLRREVLLMGKYLAGLLASVVIFTGGTALQLVAISFAFSSNTISHFLYQQNGFAQATAYLGVAALACVGYGSVFLAAGLLFRNPIIPAAAILIWEGANPLLPALLKKFSVIYYLQSMCPTQVPIDPGMPKLFVLLVSNAEPVSAFVAVLGVAAVSAAVLYAACIRVRFLEINYTTE